MPRHSKGVGQAVDLRDAAYKEALSLFALDPPTDPGLRFRRAFALTAMLKGWESASERLRIAKGIPMPGSRRPGPSPIKPKSSVGPSKRKPQDNGEVPP